MHSTQTCLVDVYDYLLDNMSSDLFTDALFLNLKKDFDTVHRNVLINKLQSLAIYGLELGWFSSYLNDRYQVTKVGDHYSTKSPVNFGVPQGSILDPFYLQFISTIFPKTSRVLIPKFIYMLMTQQSLSKANQLSP